MEYIIINNYLIISLISKLGLINNQDLLKKSDPLN